MWDFCNNRLCFHQNKSPWDKSLRFVPSFCLLSAYLLIFNFSRWWWVQEFSLSWLIYATSRDTVLGAWKDSMCTFQITHLKNKYFLICYVPSIYLWMIQTSKFFLNICSFKVNFVEVRDPHGVLSVFWNIFRPGLWWRFSVCLQRMWCMLFHFSCHLYVHEVTCAIRITANSFILTKIFIHWLS